MNSHLTLIAFWYCILIVLHDINIIINILPIKSTTVQSLKSETVIFNKSKQKINFAHALSSESLPNSNQQFSTEKLVHIWSVFRRAFYLIILFSPLLVTSWIAAFYVAFRNIIWFKLLAWTLGYSGAAFTKWGQWASTRPDVFPESLCNSLAQLQSSAPSHPYSYTKQQVEFEFGNTIENIFESFDKFPLASGSIAQIHKAMLNGSTVAVKVRHPNVEEQIKLDFDLMNGLAFLIESLPGMSWLKLSQSMAQFSKTIASQVRLNNEGLHLDIFNKNFRNWRDTSFPIPIYMTDSVLVESFLPGDSVAKIVDIVKEDHEKYLELAHFIVTRGTEVYLKMLIEDNIMHADLHPGNILVYISNPVLDKKNKFDDMKNDTRRLEVDRLNHDAILADYKIFAKNDNKIDFKLALVDAGMVAHLTSEEQRNFIGLIEALGEGNGKEAANYVLNFSNNKGTLSISNQNQRDLKFIDGMDVLFKQICLGYGRNVDLGTVLRGILNLVRIHQINIDANYATLVMNALCLDGMAKVLYPSYNVLDSAKELLRLNRRFKHLPKFWWKKFVRIFFQFYIEKKRLSDAMILQQNKSKAIARQLNGVGNRLLM